MNDVGKIRVVLIDDHTLLREALRDKLEHEADLEVVGDGGDAASALQLVKELSPDVLILDVSLPDQSGVDVVNEIRIHYPATRVVAYSMHDEQHIVTATLRAGALGYVTKTAERPTLLNAIRAVAAGHEYLSPEASAAIVKNISDPDGELTPRELEVLQLLAEGKRSPTIAEMLNISPGTVDVHRRNIMAKLDLHSIADLTRYAIRGGLVTP